jgi:peptidoglycan/LPS O-acetylase OafA/YrhL
VSIIVVHHIVPLARGNFSAGLPGFVGGYLGVDIFFVLSGFLITCLLLNEQARRGQLKILRFYGRRALRLLPALYFLLLVHGLYVYFAGLPRGPEVENVVAAGLYYKNWLGVFHTNYAELLSPSPGASGLVHLWSLSVEEQFYVVWPLVVASVLSVRRRLSTVVIVLVAMLAFIFVYRWMAFDRADSFLSLYSRTDMRADALIVGALLAVIWTRASIPRRHAGLAAFAALVVVAVFISRVDASSEFLWKGGLTLFAGCVAVVLFAVVSSGWIGNRVLEWAPLRGLGVVSYGVYLWHLVVFEAVGRHAHGLPALARVVIALTVTAAFVACSWWLVERPFLRLKVRLEPPGIASTGPVSAEIAAEPV